MTETFFKFFNRTLDDYEDSDQSDIEKNTENYFSEYFSYTEPLDKSKYESVVIKTEADLLKGPIFAGTPYDEEALKDVNTKIYIDKNIRKKIAQNFVISRLQELEELARYSGEVQPYTLEGEKPVRKLTDKEYWATRNKIIENAESFVSGESDELTLKKTMLALYEGFDVDPGHVANVSEKLNYELIEGIKKLTPEDLLNLRDPRVYITDTDFEVGPDERVMPNLVERFITNKLKGKKKPEIVREAEEKIAEFQAKRFIDFTLANTLEESPGDNLLSVTLDASNVTGVMNSIFPGLMEEVDEPTESRLKKLYGPDWKEKWGAWIITTLLPAGKGINIAGAATKNVAWVNKTYNILKGNSRLRQAFVEGVIDGISWSVFEDALSAPREYFIEGGNAAEFTYNKVKEAVLEGIIAGGAGGVLFLAGSAGKKYIWDVVAKRTAAMSTRVKPKERISLPVAEELSLAENSTPDVVRSVRRAQLGEENGMKSIVDNGEKTGADYVVGLSRDTEGFVDNPVIGDDPAFNDLSRSAGNHVEAFLSEDEAIEVTIDSGSRVHFNDDWSSVFDEANNYTKEEKVLGVDSLEGIFGLGINYTRSAKSKAARTLIKDGIQPLRRYAERLYTEEKQVIDSIWAEVPSRHSKRFKHALAYSDQNGKVLSRDELIQRGLGKRAILAYYKLKDFFDNKWEDLNRVEADILKREGYHAIKGSNIDGHGQQEIIKVIEHNYKPGKRISDSLAEDVAGYLNKRREEDPTFNWKEALDDVLAGNSTFVRVYDTSDSNSYRGVRIIPVEDIVPVERPLSYNPGYFGGTKYKDQNVFVVAFNEEYFTKKISTGEAFDEPIKHIYTGKYWVDAERHRLDNQVEMAEQGYRLVTVRTDPGNSTRSMLPADFINSFGRITKDQARKIAEELGKLNDWDEDQISNFMESLARASVNPKLRARGEALSGKGGRWMYPEKGEPYWNRNKAPVLNPYDAGIEHIKLWANTLGQGHFRNQFKDWFITNFKDFIPDPGIPFAPLKLPPDATYEQTVRFGHAKVIQKLLANTYREPTKAEQYIQNSLFTVAQKTGVEALEKGSVAYELSSKLMDELSFSQYYAPRKVKQLGSLLNFALSTSIFLQQLHPVLDSMVVYKQLPWLKVLTKDMVADKSSINPVKFMGATIDTINIDPRETVGVLKDAIWLGLLTAQRKISKGKKTKGGYKELTGVEGTKDLESAWNSIKDSYVGSKLDFTRPFRMEQELYDSWMLGEIRTIEEYGGWDSAFSGLMWSFFNIGEGIGRTFSAAASYRSLEKEFNFARKQLAKGKFRDEYKQWVNWFDSKGKLTQKGAAEYQQRASELFLQLSPENAPDLSQSYTGVITQYTSNIAANVAQKFYQGSYGKGTSSFTVGDRIRMLLLYATLFGAGTIPFFEDALRTEAVAEQAWDTYIKKQTGTKRKEEYVNGKIKALSGYMGSAMGNMDGELVYDFLNNGLLAGLSPEAKWNLTNRMYASAIYSDFIENFSNNFGDAILGPSGSTIAENVFDSPVRTFRAIGQLLDEVYPRGIANHYKEQELLGKGPEVLTQELGNVLRSATYHTPGISRLIAFVDTFEFAEQFAGDQAWKYHGVRYDREDPVGSRIKILTGLGPGYLEEVYKWQTVDNEQLKHVQNMGREVAKRIHEGDKTALPEAIEHINKLIDEGKGFMAYDYMYSFEREFERGFLTDKLMHMQEKYDSGQRLDTGY